MSTFSNPTFNHAAYAALRPTYPPSLYQTLLSYHHGPTDHTVDLGCGPGIVTLGLAPFVSRITGTDPSRPMLEIARQLSSQHANVTYVEASSESLPFVRDGEVDMVVAGQAAHWFDYGRFFPEMARVVRKGGTLAFWGYMDHVFVDFPRATEVMSEYAYGPGGDRLGDYWGQPGRSIVQNKYRDVIIPPEDWEDVQRIEYEPVTRGRHAGLGTLLLEKRMRIADCMDYVRTWSAFHAWREAHPEFEGKVGGVRGDIVDAMFEEMRELEEAWQIDGWKDLEVNVEWGSGFLMARRV